MSRPTARCSRVWASMPQAWRRRWRPTSSLGPVVRPRPWTFHSSVQPVCKPPWLDEKRSASFRVSCAIKGGLRHRQIPKTQRGARGYLRPCENQVRGDNKRQIARPSKRHTEKKMLSTPV
eukprot:scaffold76522_cov63-Phaeocystis_antarctica.AAC.3